MPFLRWAITLLIPGKTENLYTLTDPTFTWAVEANGFFLSAKSVVPQLWVTRIGVGFSFGFKSAIGITMGFVLLQCLWFSVVRQPLTIQRMHSYWISTSLLTKSRNRNRHNVSD